MKKDRIRQEMPKRSDGNSGLRYFGERGPLSERYSVDFRVRNSLMGDASFSVLIRRSFHGLFVFGFTDIVVFKHPLQTHMIAVKSLVRFFLGE